MASNYIQIAFPSKEESF